MSPYLLCIWQRLQSPGLSARAAELHCPYIKRISPFINNGAENETRTRDTELFPQHGASAQNRTVDTGIFSPLLYQLSYRGIMATRTRLELVTSAVTGRHSNQLNHRAVFSSSIISIGYFFAAVKLFYKNAAQFHGATSGYPNCLASSRRYGSSLSSSSSSRSTSFFASKSWIVLGIYRILFSA